MQIITHIRGIAKTGNSGVVVGMWLECWGGGGVGWEICSAIPGFWQEAFVSPEVSSEP